MWHFRDRPDKSSNTVWLILGGRDMSQTKYDAIMISSLNRAIFSTLSHAFDLSTVKDESKTVVKTGVMRLDVSPGVRGRSLGKMPRLMDVFPA